MEAGGKFYDHSTLWNHTRVFTVCETLLRPVVSAPGLQTLPSRV